MVIRLLNIQFMRLKRQKLLSLFFIIMAAIIISNAFQCAADSADNMMEYYAGGRFPAMCIQSYIDIIGTLFLSFISAVLICGERADGMFIQPLLNGISKKQLLTAKTISIFIVAMICFFFVITFSIGTGFLWWGTHIFDNMQEYLLQILLLAFPQTTMVLFFVFLSLYMANISSMMCASLIVLLINNLFSQFFGRYVSYLDFMYYLYAFSGYNGVELTSRSIVLGITVNIITGGLLVYGILRRAGNMIN
ncbi:MAG: ABC transporter permease [Blautia sp.]|nr:ABC transporter permease [Lachnoclostridium sp.]MCM1210308.1 ABC transporter permease [Blautia sp.]